MSRKQNRTKARDIVKLVAPDVLDITLPCIIEEYSSAYLNSPIIEVSKDRLASSNERLTRGIDFIAISSKDKLIGIKEPILQFAHSLINRYQKQIEKIEKNDSMTTEERQEGINTLKHMIRRAGEAVELYSCFMPDIQKACEIIYALGAYEVGVHMIPFHKITERGESFIPKPDEDCKMVAEIFEQEYKLLTNQEHEKTRLTICCANVRTKYTEKKDSELEVENRTIIKWWRKEYPSRIKD